MRAPLDRWVVTPHTNPYKLYMWKKANDGGRSCHVPFSRTFVLLLAACIGCQGSPSSPPADTPSESTLASRFEKIRGPAVAGLFYPRHERDLKQTVDRLLADVKSGPNTKPIPNLRALVCPHAGYEFSGPTAAIGYKQLQGRDFSTVILMGPSHYAAFAEAYVSTVDAWQTPLGLDSRFAESRCVGKERTIYGRHAVRGPCGRPGGGNHPRNCRLSAKTRPKHGSIRSKSSYLFCSERFPMPQSCLWVFGQVDPKKAAERLMPFLDDQTLGDR